jgi:hypothetical protein
MSTPTGKPFTPLSISDYAPKRVRERGATEDDSRKGEADDPPPLKLPRERPAHPGEDADERHAPLAPTGPHERSALKPDRAGDAPRGPRDLDELGAADERLTNSAYDDDLQRLESSLQAIRRKRDEASDPSLHDSRLPPAPQLSRRSETYIDGFRLPHSLAPSYVPPPPMRESTNHLGAVMRIAIACAVAAPIAYGVASYFAADSQPAKSVRGPKLATAETHLATLPPLPPSQPTEVQQAPPVPAPQMVPQPARELAWPTAPQTGNSPAPARDETISMAPRAADPVPRAPVRALDPEQIALLLKQGEQFISAGDLVTARTLFRRAAEAGDAAGALAMGATYDPVVLAKLGVRGLAPDIDQARSWYEKARDFGSAEAPRRLQVLADR